MLNCVVLMGRLTADPELRSTNSGISMCRFSVAVDRRYSGQNQERQTDFINVVAWRSTADFVCRYFRKGQMIAVQGSLQVNNYVDQNQNKRTSYDVVADNVSFCGSKAESGAAGPAPSGAAEQQQASYRNSSPEDFSDIAAAEDDLPF